MSYLPSADLAVVLLNASGTLTQEDVDLLRLLHESGIESLLLLSKADLLSEQEQQDAVAYLRAQLANQLTRAVSIYPVSSLPASGALRDAFYARELLPRTHRAAEMHAESLNRKLLELCRLVLASLRTSVQRNSSAPFEALPADVSTQLRAAGGMITGFASAVDKRLDIITENAPALIAMVAASLAQSVSAERQIRFSPDEIASALKRSLHPRVQPLLQDLLALCATVRNTIEHAKNQGPGGPPDESDETFSANPAADPFTGIFRDLPLFEPRLVAGPVQLPWFMPYLLKRLILGFIDRELRRHFGSHVTSAIAEYRQLLSQWTARRLALVEQIFDGEKDLLTKVTGDATTRKPFSDSAQVLRHIAAIESVLHPAPQESAAFHIENAKDVTMRAQETFE